MQGTCCVHLVLFRCGSGNLDCVVVAWRAFGHSVESIPYIQSSCKQTLVKKTESKKIYLVTSRSRTFDFDSSPCPLAFMVACPKCCRISCESRGGIGSGVEVKKDGLIFEIQHGHMMISDFKLTQLFYIESTTPQYPYNLPPRHWCQHERRVRDTESLTGAGSRHATY